MAAITILQTATTPTIHIGSGDPHIRGFYSERFLDSDGVTVVMPGNGQDEFYIDVQCSIDGNGDLIIPQFTIRTTNGVDNPNSRFTGQLYVDNAPQQIIFGFAAGPGWAIPEQFAPSTTWDQLDVYNQGQIQF